MFNSMAKADFVFDMNEYCPDDKVNREYANSFLKKWKDNKAKNIDLIFFDKTCRRFKSKREDFISFLEDSALVLNFAKKCVL